MEQPKRTWRLEINGILSEADAHLIAAAPELLEALTDLLGAFNEVGGGLFIGRFREVEHKARAALAKATGAKP